MLALVAIFRAVFRALIKLLLGCGLLALLAWALRILPQAQSLLELEEALRQSQINAPWIYPLLIASCNLLLLPGGVLCMGSGLIFGLWWGFALALCGNLLGAIMAFLLSRTIGRNWLAKRLKKSRWHALDHAIADEGWKIVFLSQLHPLFPTSLLNYLYGVTRIRFWPCMLWIALGQAPGLFLYAYFGTLAQLGVRYLHGKTHPRPVEFWSWGLGLLLTFGISAALGKVALKILRKSCHSKEQLPAAQL